MRTQSIYSVFSSSLSCTMHNSQGYIGKHLTKNDYEIQFYISAELRWIYYKNYGSSERCGNTSYHFICTHTQNWATTKVLIWFSLFFLFIILPNASKMKLRFYYDLGYICNRDTNLVRFPTFMEILYKLCNSIHHPQNNNNNNIIQRNKPINNMEQYISFIRYVATHVHVQCTYVERITSCF